VAKSNSIDNYKSGAECARELRDLADKLEKEDRMINVFCQTWFMETREYCRLVAARKTIPSPRPSVNMHENKIQEIRLLLESSKSKSSNSSEGV
jgi:hypothetical protein